MSSSTAVWTAWIVAVTPMLGAGLAGVAVSVQLIARVCGEPATETGATSGIVPFASVALPPPRFESKSPWVPGAPGAGHRARDVDRLGVGAPDLDDLHGPERQVGGARLGTGERDGRDLRLASRERRRLGLCPVLVRQRGHARHVPGLAQRLDRADRTGTRDPQLHLSWVDLRGADRAGDDLARADGVRTKLDVTHREVLELGAAHAVRRQMDGRPADSAERDEQGQE